MCSPSHTTCFALLVSQRKTDHTPHAHIQSNDYKVFPSTEVDIRIQSTSCMLPFAGRLGAGSPLHTNCFVSVGKMNEIVHTIRIRDLVNQVTQAAPVQVTLTMLWIHLRERPVFGIVPDFQPTPQFPPKRSGTHPSSQKKKRAKWNYALDSPPPPLWCVSCTMYVLVDVLLAPVRR